MGSLVYFLSLIMAQNIPPVRHGGKVKVQAGVLQKLKMESIQEYGDGAIKIALNLRVNNQKVSFMNLEWIQ